MMSVCRPIYCPECPKKTNSRGKEIGVQLECAEGNYSGTGEDMANCPKCGKGYAISYQVKEITRAEDWDIDVEAERAAEAKAREEAKKEEIEELETRLARLKGKGGY